MSPLLRVDDLSVELPGGRRAVDRAGFTLERGESLALVGESGSGKTLTAKAIMRLLPRQLSVRTGRIELDGEELLGAPEKRLRSLRAAKVAMIFQDPMTALNPVMTAGAQVAELYQIHRRLSRRAAGLKAEEMLHRVRLADPARAAKSYPHQLSGGMRQRVVIAMALALDPLLLIADEPTTALDVTVQAEILALIADLKKERGTSVLLITHDLAVVAEVCERAMVMYAGQIVESAPVARLFDAPLHPYTAGLLGSLPDPKNRGQKLRAIPGMVPGPFPAEAIGCRFAERCPRRESRCTLETPDLFERTAGTERTDVQKVRCFFPGEVKP